jgi:hypothetical protein
MQNTDALNASHFFPNSSGAIATREGAYPFIMVGSRSLMPLFCGNVVGPRRSGQTVVKYIVTNAPIHSAIAMQRMMNRPFRGRSPVAGGSVTRG